MYVLRSLWNRSRPGNDPVARHIRFCQWTAIHLAPDQHRSGIIPLRHIARILTFARPPGPTQVRAHNHWFPAERIDDVLIVPATLLTQPIVHIRHHAEGFQIEIQPPNSMATHSFLQALRHAGWQLHDDPFDSEGQYILPALIAATTNNASLRRQPTLPLTLVRAHQYEPARAATLG